MHSFDVCPRCGHQLVPAKSFSGAPSEFWLSCENFKCNTYVNTYIPQDHQRAFHVDPHTFKGSFGGYGSGKTLTDRQQFYKHALITPGGNTIIGANVASQYEQTIKRDIEADIPAAFVRNFNTQKQYMDLINGHRIMYRPFDDPNKLRSYNVSMFIIIEGSEVKRESFTQLKTRLRNMTAATQLLDPVTGEPQYTLAKNGVPIPIYEHDWREGIIESNPDAGKQFLPALKLLSNSVKTLRAYLSF